MKTYKKVWGLVMIFFAGCQIMAQSTQQYISRKQARSGRTSGQFGHKGEVPSMQTVADVIVATPDLKIFAGLLKRHNLLSMLQGNSSFTVFAPTNEAFTEDIMYTLNNLSNQEVTNVLKRHIVNGAYFYSQLYQVPLQTLTNEILDNGTLSVKRSDIRATNGVVDVVNEVLIPFKDFK